MVVVAEEAVGVAVVAAEEINMRATIENIPTLGVGLGYRDEIASSIVQHEHEIDFLEIIPENYIGHKGRMQELLELSTKFTIIPHPVECSLGSSQKTSPEFVKSLSDLASRLHAPYWSEHISFTQTNAHDIGHLSPIPYHEDMLEILCDNVTAIQRKMRQPLILENITYALKFSSGVMEETTFMNKLHQKTGCGFLLDVTNLFINSRNHEFNPYEYVEALQKTAIVQLHLIGYEKRGETYSDTHGAEIQDELWELYQYILEQAPVKGVIIEWDKAFPDDFEVILNQLTKAKSIWNKVYAIA